MSVTALRWENDPETEFRWTIQVEKGLVLLTLVGGRHRMTTGVVQAVAPGINGHVQLQCLLSVKLLFPDTYLRHGVTRLAHLPGPQAAYSLFRAVDLDARPTDTVEVAAVPSRTCAALLISMKEDMFTAHGLPSKLIADLAACSMGAAGSVAAALAYANMSSGNALQTLHCCLLLAPSCHAQAVTSRAYSHMSSIAILCMSSNYP